MKQTSGYQTFNHTLLAAVVAIACAATAQLAHAHTNHQQKSTKAQAPLSTEQTAFGQQGDPKKVDRTITIEMDDKMRFSPAIITLKQGQTIRFVVKNRGHIMHEMVLGTLQELQEHGEMMKKYPDMEHDDPHAVHVKSGKQEDLVWRFTKPGEFYYACLIPGHFEAGMMGKIIVKKG